MLRSPFRLAPWRFALPLLLLTPAVAPAQPGLPPGPVWRGDAAPSSARDRAGTPTGREVPRAPDGHFYVVGVVNGAPIRFVVDTGASVVMLTPEDARRAGISVPQGSFRAQARTATGLAMLSPTRITRMAVAGIEARDVPAAVAGVETGLSLLGMSYLRRLKRVTIENDVLRIE